MIEKRLFVGNLPLGIGKKDVKKKFSNYGNVLDVEVKHRKDDTDNITSTFAFVNINADVADLSNCINEMSHQDWNGRTIKVEYAKENILSRLEKERNQKQDNEQQSALKRKTDSFSSSESKLPRISLSYDSISTSEKPENIRGHPEYNGRLKMFGGTKSSHDQKYVGRNEDLKNEHYNGDILERFEACSDVWNDSNTSRSFKMNNRNFYSNSDDKDHIHNRHHPKSVNYGFEIYKSEVKNTGVVKPYVSSDSDSEGVNETSSMKLSYKGTKKLKIDTVNYNGSASMKRIDNKNMPLKKGGRWSSGNFKVRETEQDINGHIDNNAVDTEADQSVSTESKHLNQMSQVSEERRQKCVLEKMKALNKQKKLIKRALRQVDSKNRLNKKIVFSDDDDDGERLNENKNSTGKKSSVRAASKKNNTQKTLFDDGSDSDINEELSKLNINRQFEGDRGQKLLELQSRYAYDDRFVLDSRFYESDNEDNNQEDNKNQSKVTENAVEKGEVQRQLDILEDVLGYQIKKPPSDKKKKDINEDTALLRFDPTKSEHSRYIISTSTSGETKAKRKKHEAVVDVPKNPTEVSKERFYKIDDSLKESLKHSSKNNSGFSVLQLLGCKPNEDENKNNEDTSESVNKNDEAHYMTESTLLPFKPKHKPRNPFKYDSSDSDEEEVEEQPMQDNKQSAENNTSFIGLWTETFFLQDKDSRLKEAKDFFMNSNFDNEEEENYKNKRKFLKKIVRWKSKNTEKYNKPFKTKLGGHSTKVKRSVTFKVRKFQKRQGDFH